MCFDLCEMQSRIFERSVIDHIPSNTFIRSYMLSTPVKYVDRLESSGSETDEVFIYDIVKNKIEVYRGTLFSIDEMKWIGYIYRAISYLLDLTSREIFKKITPNYLREVYKPYHTFDVIRAIEEIFEDTGFNIETKESKFKSIYTKMLNSYK